MPHYLRGYVPGGSYFFAVALLERRRRLVTAHIDALRTALRSVHIQRPFRIDAIAPPITSIASGRYRRTMRISRRADA
jgi:putative transposase